jgi:hypothetical protein
MMNSNASKALLSCKSGRYAGSLPAMTAANAVAAYFASNFATLIACASWVSILMI